MQQCGTWHPRQSKAPEHRVSLEPNERNFLSPPHRFSGLEDRRAAERFSAPEQVLVRTEGVFRYERGGSTMRLSAPIVGTAALALIFIGRPLESQSIVPVDLQRQVNTYTDDYQRYPALGYDGSGNLVVVWESDGSLGSDDSSSSIKAESTTRMACHSVLKPKSTPTP